MIETKAAQGVGNIADASGIRVQGRRMAEARSGRRLVNAVHFDHGAAGRDMGMFWNLAQG